MAWSLDRLPERRRVTDDTVAIVPRPLAVMVGRAGTTGSLLNDGLVIS
jgi:hypothetical protein